jgi:hypothetical protein
MGYLVDQTIGCPFWIRYHLESGLADERTIVRLQFTKTNIADDDIILGAVSQPVPLTRVSADTLEVYWTPSIDRLYSGIDRSHSVIMTARAGQYAVKAELIGLDTGRVYSEYSRALPVSLITVTTHGSGPAVVGQAADYTLTYHNARNEAVPEPFVATMLIDQFIGTPLSLTPEALVVKYQDPTDQLWKPATLARNATGVIEARFGEYSLAAGADLTVLHLDVRADLHAGGEPGPRPEVREGADLATVTDLGLARDRVDHSRPVPARTRRRV